MKADGLGCGDNGDSPHCHCQLRQPALSRAELGVMASKPAKLSRVEKQIQKAEEAHPDHITCSGGPDLLIAAVSRISKNSGGRFSDDSRLQPTNSCLESDPWHRLVSDLQN